MALLGRSKPVHLRGCSREDGDVVFAAEDAKRPRAASPSSVASPAATSTGSRARPVEESSSIYKLTSPWLTVPAPKESHALASMEEGGGARVLCFDEEGQGEGQEEDQDQEVEKRFFALKTSISNVSSAPSEPVDIPGARRVKEDSGARTATGVPSAYSLEEEGWVSLWNTYTRLFPGTFIGCSPPDSQPPPDSPLYAASPPKHARARAPSTSTSIVSSRRNACRYPCPPSSPSLSSSSFLGETSTSTSTWTPLPSGAPADAVGGGGAAGTTTTTTTTTATATTTSATDASTDDCFDNGEAAAMTHIGGNTLPASWTMMTATTTTTAATTTTTTVTAGNGDAVTRQQEDSDAARRRPFALPPPLVLSHSPLGGNDSHLSPPPPPPQQQQQHGNHRRHHHKHKEKPHKAYDGTAAATQQAERGENPPAKCSWGQLSRLPLEEAGKVLGTFSAKGFSAGGGVGVGGGRGGIRGEEEDDDDDDGDDEDPEDLDFFSGTDLDSSDSDDLMFELEI